MGDAHGLNKDSGCLKVRLLEGHSLVRVTTAFNMLLQLAGVNVTAVTFHSDRVVVNVRLRRRRLVCPRCGWSTRWRYDTQPHPSTWRALDLGVWRVTVRATRKQLSGASDQRVYDVCRSEVRLLVTLDLDFANPFRFDPAPTAGIAVIRVPTLPGLHDLEAGITSLVAELNKAPVRGRLWIVGSQRVREYRPESPEPEQ